MDLRHFRHPHGLERAQPDMECQVGDEHTSGPDPLKNFSSEMQPGGGCGDRATLTRKDGLVTLAIQRLVLTANVGGQRDMPQKLQPGEEIVHRREAKKTFTELTAQLRPWPAEARSPSGGAKASC